MRITTGMMSTRYVRNLNKSEAALNHMYEQVATGRSFFKGSEDPTGAIKAYKLRREYKYNEMYATNISDAESFLTLAESNLTEISNNLGLAYTSSLSGITGTMSSEDREIIAKELDNLQDSILTALNGKFEDRYVFGGTNKTEKPFSIDDNGNLLYKGINVNDGSSNFDPPKTNAEGLEILEELSNEAVNIDVGLGIEYDETGTVKDSTVFNMAIPGIKFLGYGTDQDGKPNNLFSLIGEIKDQLRRDDFSMDNIRPYIEKYSEQKNNVLIGVTDIGAKANYLDFIKLRSEDYQYDLSDRLSKVEYVDTEEAATNFAMQKYSYNAALAVGNKLLQNSFIDFMS
nr:flagellar hook-associated protein FlgL [Sedimentibacter sp.]